MFCFVLYPRGRNLWWRKEWEGAGTREEGEKGIE